MNTDFERQGQLDLDYDCTAQEAIESQADNAKAIQNAIQNSGELSAADKDVLTARLKREGASRLAKRLHETYNYQGESVVAALPVTHIASALPKTIAATLMPRLKDTFVKSGVSGAGELMDIVETDAKREIMKDIQRYNLAIGNLRRAPKVEGIADKEKREAKNELIKRAQENIFMYSVATAIWHKLTTGYKFWKVELLGNEIHVFANLDEILHCAFGELYQDGAPLKGFGELLRKSDFLKIFLQMVNDADYHPTPIAYSLKKINGERTILELPFARHGRYASEGGKVGIDFILNTDFFPFRKASCKVNKKTGQTLINRIYTKGGFCLNLAGLFPLMACVDSWCNAKHRETYATAFQKYKYFTACAFSDKNGAAFGIDEKDFAPYWQNYRTVNSQHSLRLGEIPLAEMLNVHTWIDKKTGKKKTDWGEICETVDGISRNLYAFMKDTKYLQTLKDRLSQMDSELYLPVDALSTYKAQSVRIRTAAFDEWCELMEQSESRARAKSR